MGLARTLAKVAAALALLFLCLVFSLAVEPSDPVRAKVALVVVLAILGSLIFLLVRPSRPGRRDPRT